MPFYLDTSPLVSWADARVGGADSDLAAIAVRVEEIVASGDAVSISEITLIEFHDVLLRHAAEKDPGADWVEGAQETLMTWISDGEIRVLPHPNRSVEVAMSYITMARRQGRSLKAFDALHVFMAIEWARSVGQRVTVVTGDDGMRKFIELFPTFSEFIDLEMLSSTT